VDASPYKEEIADGVIFTGSKETSGKKGKSHNKKR
jgi:hypothetical protein